MLYPLYFCAVNGAIALVIRRRRRALAPGGRRAALEQAEGPRTGRLEEAHA